jgi:O-antigen ligase
MAVFAWALVTCFWSPVPFHGAQTAIRLVVLVLVGWCLIDVARHASAYAGHGVLLAWTGGVLAALAMIAIEVAFDQPIYRTLTATSFDTAVMLSRINRGATFLAMVVWPLAVALWANYGRGSAIGVVLVTAGTIMLTPSDTAKVAILLGIALFGLAWVRWHLGAVAIAIGLVVGVAASPWTVQGVHHLGVHKLDMMPVNAVLRIDYWAYAGDVALQRPVAGLGFESSRKISAMAGDRLPDADGLEVLFHPHNAGLQLWLELGAVGALLALGVAAFTIRACRRADGLMQAGALTVLGVTTQIALVTYSLWQTQWVATMLWAVMATVLLAGVRSRVHRGGV